ncbi:MAG: APC family permease [Polyangiaceae bacterium]
MPLDQAATTESTLAHSAELRRELGVRDLVLAQVLIIVGGSWVGTAGKLGPGNLAYWMAAAVLFFAPLVAVVLFLNRWVSLEGGLYQWAKLAFGPGVGFLVAFNLWLTAMALMSTLGVDTVQALAYGFDRLAWMRNDPLVAQVTSAVIIAGLAAAALGGLHVGKRVHNFGGAIRLGTYGVLILLPLGTLLLGHPLRPEAARVEAPPVTLLGVNLLAKMGFAGFSGLEYVAIFAGESRDSMRAFARSVRIAAPLVVVMYVAGTAAVLAYVAPADIDLIAPVPQAFGRAAASFGPAVHLASAASAVMVIWAAVTITNGSAMLAGITRLPMVAGWDGLLPEWFTRLSPRARAPVNSILFVSGVTIVLAVTGLAGVGHQEAFQLLISLTLVFWALAYLVMFAIPIIGRGQGLPRPPVWLRVAAASGFAMTLLFVVLSVFPIAHVESELGFGLKLTGIVVGANVIGAGIYLAGKRRRATASATAA